MGARRSLRERQWQVREDAILEAAQRLIHERGYSAMSMDELAAEVGISKATLYQHVDSKEELAVRAIARSVRQMLLYIDGQDPTIPALSRLKSAVGTFVERRFSDGPFGPVFSKTLGPLLRSYGPFQQYHTELMQRLEHLIEEARDEGSITSHLPSTLLARMMMSCARDPGYESLITSGDYTIDELRTAVLTFIFEGIGTPHQTQDP